MNSSVRVLNTSDGVEIVGNTNKPDNYIKLSPTAWEKLVSYRAAIAEHVELGLENAWVVVEEPEEVRVSTSIFNGRMYVHIRTWFDGRPTKRGTSTSDWEALDRRLTGNVEIDLGCQVYERMVKEAISLEIKKMCEGCELECASQTDHDCMMRHEELTTRALETVKIRAPAFILELAKDAKRKGLILERPNETYRRVESVHAYDIRMRISKEES